MIRGIILFLMVWVIRFRYVLLVMDKFYVFLFKFWFFFCFVRVFNNIGIKVGNVCLMNWKYGIFELLEKLIL